MISPKSSRSNKKRKLYNQSNKFKIKPILKTTYPNHPKNFSMEIQNSINKPMGIKINLANLINKDLIVIMVNIISKGLKTTANTINKGHHMIKTSQ